MLMDLMEAIVITGTPGTGKTSGSEAASRMLGLDLWHLGEIAKECGALSKDPDRDTLVIDPIKLKRLLRKRLGSGEGCVIIEGHYGEIVPKGMVKLALVLSTDPRVLETRLRLRGYSEEKVRENVEAELLDYCLIKAIESFGEEKVFEIDTTGLEAERLGEEIASAVKGERRLKPGSINWMAMLDGEGSLQRYLR